MWFESFLRNQLRRLIIQDNTLALESKIPLLEKRLQAIDDFGLYLHIPFCRQICPYCPYNKEIYRPEMAENYTKAVLKEIDIYSEMLGSKPLTSFYIGGGTPTTMLYSGLDQILDRIFKAFNMQCEVHMESHPNDLSQDNLSRIVSMGVQHLSMGVEALQDRHLKTLQRPYTVEKVKAAIERAVSTGFQCVNVDVIFDLPGQSFREIEQTGSALVDSGVDQVAAYPLFRFPYTQMGVTSGGENYQTSSIFRRRKMLRILERIFYEAGFERTSVWAFTRAGVPRYCSVTVPLYIGLGASGGSYLKDIFYLNTFNVGEYIKALEKGRLPIALSLELTEGMQLAGWLYWRIYETKFEKKDFKRRFGMDFDSIYGKYIKPLSRLGLLKESGGRIVLSDQGAYWLHVLEDLFSLEYVSKLWGTSKEEPWPQNVIL